MKPLDDFGFLIRQNFSLDFINVELPCHSFGGYAAVASEHYDANSFIVQLTNRFRCRLLDRIGNTDQTRHFIVNHDEHHGLTISSQRVGFGCQVTRINSHLVEQCAIAQGH